MVGVDGHEFGAVLRTREEIDPLDLEVITDRFVQCPLDAGAARRGIVVKLEVSDGHGVSSFCHAPYRFTAHTGHVRDRARVRSAGRIHPLS
jgi:hypothetical protein